MPAKTSRNRWNPHRHCRQLLVCRLRICPGIKLKTQYPQRQAYRKETRVARTKRCSTVLRCPLRRIQRTGHCCCIRRKRCLDIVRRPVSSEQRHHTRWLCHRAYSRNLLGRRRIHRSAHMAGHLLSSDHHSTSSSGPYQWNRKDLRGRFECKGSGSETVGSKVSH